MLFLPVLDDLQVLQFLGDLHAVEPLLLLVDPHLAGSGFTQHLVEGQGVLQGLLPEPGQLCHLLVALLNACEPVLNLQTQNRQRSKVTGDCRDHAFELQVRELRLHLLGVGLLRW